MTHVKAFVKRLSDTAQLHTLVPADVPRGKVSAKIPKYLTKEELALIMHRLEKNVAEAILTDNKHTLYSAYLWRAVVRMLYSSGLRNSELRSLTYDDITIPQLCGVVL